MSNLARRDFLGLAALAFAQARCGGGGGSATTTTGAPATAPTPLAFDRSERALREVADDFGHLVHHVPESIFRPTKAEDVAEVIKLAVSRRAPITMRGEGHCAYGQSQVDGGILVSTRELRRVAFKRDDEIEAEAGASWADVVDLALSKGMTPPVLPDTIVGLTVGGVLSVGGIGESSHRAGAIVDNVRSLDFATGRGELVRCSTDTNSELFDLALAGLGQCGFIVRARLALVSAPESLERSRATYADPRSLLRDLENVARGGSASFIAGSIMKTGTKWQYGATLHAPVGSTDAALRGEPAEPKAKVPYRDYVHRLTRSFLDLPAAERALPRPYLAFFLPRIAAERMLEQLALDDRAALGAKNIAVFPLLRSNLKRPLLAMPDDDTIFAFRIYRKADREGSESHRDMLSVNDELVLQIQSEGGTVYPPHAPVLTHEQWKNHWRGAFAALETGKARLDPERLLNRHAVAWA